MEQPKSPTKRIPTEQERRSIPVRTIVVDRNGLVLKIAGSALPKSQTARVLNEILEEQEQ